MTTAGSTTHAHRLSSLWHRLFADTGRRELLRSRLFWAVLFLKLTLGTLAASYYLRDLFIPFVNYFVESGFSDPWDHFAALNRVRSFPYPLAMLTVLALPRWLLDPLLPSGTETVTLGHLLAMRLPLLVADTLIALILTSWFPNRWRQVLFFYWASPIVAYVTYWHGQLDVIPTCWLLLALFLVHRERPTLSAVALGLGLASKSHLLIALPFLWLYLWRDAGPRRALLHAVVTVITYLLVLLPFLDSPGFIQLVYGSSEQARFFAFQLELGFGQLSLVVAPFAVLVLWFRFAAYPKRNWDLLMLYLGLLFSVFVILVPPQPGYFLWSLPFFVFFLCRTPHSPLYPYYLYMLAYFSFFWLGPESDLFDAWRLLHPPVADWPMPEHLLVSWFGNEQVILGRSLIFSVMETALAGIVLQIYMVGVRSNAIYAQRSGPTMIGLAGDSGSGKDTFAQLMTGLFGKREVLTISGDDYHRWPRGHEMWKVYTHLDVRANDLHRQHEHAIAIFGGQAIYKGTYDHATGSFTQERQLTPRSIVIFSGLHSLSVESQSHLYDLKIFLDPDEELRHFWKVKRDCAERGYSVDEALAALKARDADRQRYILPQRSYADIVVRLLPNNPIDMSKLETSPQLTLEMHAPNNYNLTGAAESLQAVDTLKVAFEPFTDARWQVLRVTGSISAETLGVIAQQIIPNLDEITRTPKFVSGVNGCLQLLFLVCLSSKMRLLRTGDIPAILEKRQGVRAPFASQPSDEQLDRRSERVKS